MNKSHKLFEEMIFYQRYICEACFGAMEKKVSNCSEKDCQEKMNDKCIWLNKWPTPWKCDLHRNKDSSAVEDALEGMG